MPREVAALHNAGRVRSGDPDRLVRDTVLRHLERACADTGVRLGALDRRKLEWLAGWEPTTAQVFIGLIYRAHKAGRLANRSVPDAPLPDGTLTDGALSPQAAAEAEAEQAARDEDDLRGWGT
jgi:hypothetical protein